MNYDDETEFLIKGVSYAVYYNKQIFNGDLIYPIVGVFHEGREVTDNSIIENIQDSLYEYESEKSLYR